MFARFITLLPIAALAAVAVAAPNAPEARTDSCNSGSVYCCDQTFTNESFFKKESTGLLGVVGIIGLNGGAVCDPITVIGLLSNGGQCTQQTACCKDVDQDGLVNVACSPINVGV